MHQTLFFDLDGTITDPYEGISRSTRHGMQAVGCPLAHDRDLRFCIGPPLLESLQALLGPDKADLAAAAMAAYRERFKAVGMFENVVYEKLCCHLSSLG